MRPSIYNSLIGISGILVQIGLAFHSPDKAKILKKHIINKIFIFTRSHLIRKQRGLQKDKIPRRLWVREHKSLTRCISKLIVSSRRFYAPENIVRGGFMSKILRRGLGLRPLQSHLPSSRPGAPYSIIAFRSKRRKGLAEHPFHNRGGERSVGNRIFQHANNNQYAKEKEEHALVWKREFGINSMLCTKMKIKLKKKKMKIGRVCGGSCVSGTESKLVSQQ